MLCIVTFSFYYFYLLFFPVPEDFDYNPHTGKHGDRSHRLELKRSSVEYIAPSEYMVSPQSDLCGLGGTRLRVHTVHATSNNVLAVIARECRLYGKYCMNMLLVILECMLAQVRPPQPSVFYFVIDVSHNTIEKGECKT